VYPGPNGSTLDQLCSGVTNAKINRNWVQETIQRLPEFQSIWDKDSSAYSSILSREVGLDFPFGEVQATPTVCPAIPSMGSPLIIRFLLFLESAEGDRLPKSLFSILVFHELMHRYTARVHDGSELERKYAAEPFATRHQLHTIALERLVLSKLAKSDELKQWEEVYRTRRSPEQKRAWDIVTKESIDSFVRELRQLRK